MQSLLHAEFASLSRQERLSFFATRWRRTHGVAAIRPVRRVDMHTRI
jgi:hypothetical protein